MRQALLIVILVGASFLGGAFVNGPGVQWAQSRVLRLLRLNNVEEITSVNLSSANLPTARLATPPLEGPIAPVPSLITDGVLDNEDITN